MLAQITVDKKAVRNKSFTYRIPNSLRPRLGSLVLIPFHGQRVAGVINSLQKDRPTKYKIKEIESIIYPQSLFNQNQLKLANFIAKKYYAPISSVIFAMLPQYLRRIKRAETINQSNVIPAKAGIHRFRVKHGMTSRHYLLFDPQNKYTLKIYQKAIKSTLGRGQNVLFLVPGLSLGFIRQIKLLSKKSLVLDKKSLTDKEFFLKWQAIRQGKFDLVIGSHLALFAPLENLGLVIVHEERNQFYKNEQLPKYHLREVAIKLAQLNNANLILQAEIPSLESYLALARKKLQLIPFKKIPSLSLHQKIKIIDLKQERDLLSLTAINKIESNLKQRKKTLLFLNRKGFSRFYICSDCGFSKHLESDESIPALCPQCSGANGREHSFGTRRLEFELKKLFPKARVLRIDKEKTYANNPILSLRGRRSRPWQSNEIASPLTRNDRKTYDIIIATSYIFKFDLIFDSVIIILAEIGLSLPDFRKEEDLFYTLFRALKSGREKIIQTFYPEHRVFKYLLLNDFKTFANKELRSRQENNYPPFTTLIRLTYQGKPAKREADKLINLLNKLNQSENSPNQILGPSPVFIQPNAGNKYEIILKGKNPYPLLSLVPQNWKVDVDPVELLK